MAEDIMGINAHQVRVGDRINRHTGNYPHAEAQAYIGLNDIGIGRGKNYTRLKPRTVERGVQFRTSGKSKRVGHQRVLRQFLQWIRRICPPTDGPA